MNQVQLLQPQELATRIDRIRRLMQAQGIDALVINSFANIQYLTGRVFNGYIVVSLTAPVRYFVQRPTGMGGDDVTHIRKPEDMAVDPVLAAAGTVGLELDLTSFSKITRLQNIVPHAAIANASPVMREARAVKTDAEVELIRKSGIKQTYVYSRVPKMFRDGMTDLDLQVAIENLERIEGCLGQFRVSGDTMEIYMGNVITGKNADVPTPYDFAMGGAGINPSLPVGAAGEVILEGNSVMVDMNGNFTGYMTDMTRVFSLGQVSVLAAKAHECSRKICREFERTARPGVAARQLYEMAERTAKEAGLADYFMGHHQKAGFVGHGVGIDINELPVLSPRSRDMLQRGNVIALEPKFVIPGTGAVGIENTYLICDDHVECLTNAPEGIIAFE